MRRTWFVALSCAGCTLLAPARSELEGGDAGSAPSAGADGGAPSPVVAFWPSTTLWEGPGEVAGIAGGTNVAFSVRRSIAGGGEILLVNTQRLGAPSVVASGLGQPGAMEADSAAIFWVDGAANGAIARASRLPDGGAPRSIAQTSPLGLALGGGRVHWISGGSILSVAQDFSATPTVLASGQAAPSAITFGTNAVYWINSGTGEIWSRTIGPNASPERRLSGELEAAQLGVHQRSLYWIRTGVVYRADLDASPIVPAAVAEGAARALAVDESGVYWLTGAGVRRVRHGSATVEILADGQAGCDSVLAVDSTAVVYACNGPSGGKVVRLLK